MILKRQAFIYKVKQGNQQEDETYRDFCSLPTTESLLVLSHALISTMSSVGVQVRRSLRSGRGLPPFSGTSDDERETVSDGTQQPPIIYN